MKKEIEHRFCVRDNAWQKKIVDTLEMVQGYLPGAGGLTYRVRIVNEKAAFTIKGPSDATRLARNEVEFPMPLADAQFLLDTHQTGALIHKKRHIVWENNQRWEVDVFAGENAGLVIAELECDTLNSIENRPAWIGHEITARKELSNFALSQRPWSTWTEAEKMTLHSDP